MQSWVLTAIIVGPADLMLHVVLEGSPWLVERWGILLSQTRAAFYSSPSHWNYFIDRNWRRVDYASARPVHG